VNYTFIEPKILMTIVKSNEMIVRLKELVVRRDLRFYQQHQQVSYQW